MLAQLQAVEPFLEVADGHLHEIGDAHAVDFHIFGFLFQTCAVTIRTDGLSAIAAHHHAILYLVLVLLDHVEESVDGYLLVDVLRIGGKSVPKPVFFLSRQVHVGLEDGEIVAGCTPAEFVLPLLHLLTVPALHAAFIDGEGGIGNHQFLVDADDAAETLAGGTGPKRGVEGKHIIAGLLKLDAVSFETGGEIVGNVAGKEHQAAFAVALIESRLCGVQEA